MTGVPASGLAVARRHLVGNVEDLPRLLAQEFGVERRAELGGADEVQVVRALEVLEVAPAPRCLDVDGDEVLVDDRTIGGLELREPLAQALDPLVDLLVGDRRVRRLHLHPGVVLLGELQARAHLHDGREDQRGRVLEGLQVDLGVGDGREVLVGDGAPVVLGHGGVEELLVHHVATDLGVDDGLRHLALAEPGDLDLVGHAPIRGIEVLGVLLDGHLDREFDGVFGGVLDGRLHTSVQATRDRWPRLGAEPARRARRRPCPLARPCARERDRHVPIERVSRQPSIRNPNKLCSSKPGGRSILPALIQEPHVSASRRAGSVWSSAIPVR